jgi:tetratricopeptide (TPR) repeat protein
MMADANAHTAENLETTISGLRYWLFGSAVVVAVYAIGSGFGAPYSSFSHAGLNAAWALAVGALTGFLFGIPRTLQREDSQQATNGRSQKVNTNLEQISDWLTKILVGVGLTQLQRLPESLWRLGNAFPLGESPALGLALLLNFLIGGFFGGYLLTRLFLTTAFDDLEKSLSPITERASELADTGRFDQALAQFEVARSQITNDTPEDEKLEVYQGLVFTSLYKPPPGGFEDAIKYALEYIAKYPDEPDATIFAYLAAAYGQQYRYLIENPPEDKAALKSARDNALGAAQRALKTDPEIKWLLQLVWKKDYPGKSWDDNDLEVFQDDPDFVALLGA